ncbi:MAG: DoxX family protein [Thermoplasmata archaeon]|nr:DoxX family protein [Thermoplasmata archaeon]
MTDGVAVGGAEGNWWARNAHQLKTVFRVLFGGLWLVDGAFKFAPGLVDDFPGMIVTDGQPAWLQPWFQFWATQAAQNPAFWVYTTGVLELAVGLALVFGLLRKIAYIGGAILSLFIWAVPEGFGGPYGAGSTDPGGGIVYAMVFLMLIVINAAYGPSKWSLDFLIERRWPFWAKLAEFRGMPSAA